MQDAFDRPINYLRVSVTDRCNLRCSYCMPDEGVSLIPSDRILSFEEITAIVGCAARMGIDKVRLTGGEPLVRRGIVELVAMLSRIDGIRDLAMTTNGLLLREFARPLADAGLHRVNVSLDSMSAPRYRELTRGGELARALDGIAAAEEAGLLPIHLNCVISRSSQEPDAQAVAEFGLHHGHVVRFIRQMDTQKG